MAGAETTTRRGRRPRAPSPWVLAAGLLAVAGLAFVGASRVGDDIDRLERAESLSFQLEARAFEQAVLESRTSASGVPDDSARQRADTLRRETAGALAELTSLLPGDRDAPRVGCAQQRKYAGAPGCAGSLRPGRRGADRRQRL